MLRMIRIRIALYAQAALAVICVLGFRNFTETFSHPLGLAESAYRWAAWASLLITGWLCLEAIIMAFPRIETRRLAWVRGGKCVAILILSLLLLLIAEFAVDGM